MKTHLPHGLRAALMAVIASVSLTTAYGAAPTISGQYAIDWSKVKPAITSTIQGVNKGITVFSPTIPADETKYKWYSPSTNSKYTGYTGTDLKYINVVRSETEGTTLGDVYFDMVGGKADYGISGLANATEKTANIYVRVGESDSAHNVTFVRGTEYTTLKGNAYVELNDSKATYTEPVGGAHSSNTAGSSTIVIRDGRFNSWVAAGFSEANRAGYTIGGGTYLQIEKGTFNSIVMGGTSFVGNTATINGGSHLLINGGTFNKDVYGGSAGAYGVVNDGVDITVNGGTFNTGSNIYALGSNGKVSGDIKLTIGNKAKFAANSVISAGANGTKGNYSGVTSSTVTLSGLTGTNSLLADKTIKVMGGQQRSSLVMNNVIGTINAQLSQFSDMQVGLLSNLTLRQATNEALGGVSKVKVLNGSSLTLDNDAGQTWDLSRVAMVNIGTLNKTGAGKLTIGDATGFDGTINVQSGGLTLSGATKAGSLTVANGSTLSVKEGDLFTRAAGAGSTISINNGATLAANEGNWTLNKAATINGVTITGKAAVALGSEVDNAAVVTMSGNINATKGNLILKNTAIAADKTATLSGNITFEGAVDNKGTLSIGNGSTINIDEQSLIRNAKFVENGETSKNGFLTDSAIALTTGSNYSVNKDNVTLTLDGATNDKLVLTKDADALHIRGYADIVKGTYFVNEGDVAYTDIQKVTDQTLTAIAVGNDGVGDTHQLTLDDALADGVTIISASDNAKVAVNKDVVLNASQTAIKGEANEVHIVGAGSVLMDDTNKLSQLAGTATMTLQDTATTFNSEAKMTGALVVDNGQTLKVTDDGSIASFSEVTLNGSATLNSDSIQSLSGSGSLSKTGDGTLTVEHAQSFSGNIEASEGTLNLMNSENASVNELNIHGGATVGVYKNDTAESGAEDANVGTLTLSSGALVIGADGGTLEADLVINGGTISFVQGSTLTMGCSVTIGTSDNTVTIVLDAAEVAVLQGGGTLDIFTDVEGVTLNNANITFTNMDRSETYDDFSLETVETSSGKHTIRATATPEPATATLSLLALAGLAARRKRK